MGTTASRTALVSALVAQLEEARRHTMALVAPLSDEDLRTQHDPLMSPILWDLGHIAHFEELWLTHNLHGEIKFSEMPGMYNPFEHPRRVRGELVYPTLDECWEIMNEIRRRVIEKLETLDWTGPSPLLRAGYVVHMVLQHEYQHNETMMQTLQLKKGAPYPTSDRRALPSTPLHQVGGMVRFPGGEVTIGTNDRRVAYDNERPRFRMVVRPFRIDVAPVTNGDYLRFMEDGGYARRELWSPEGWAWAEQEQARSPKYWSEENGAWHARTMDRVGPVDPQHPVCHVCYHEADAFARWAGKRLPTEIEWEVAASWDPREGRARDYPWGSEPPSLERANLDQLGFGTTPVGAYAANVSPLGCVDMIGNVWEWTSSDFSGWPGFQHFPYPEYSEVFFGNEYKVLRGGSWATRPGAIRNTFRNWDYPIRRQIFSGFRCASDD
ncbi:MAG: ergothioneine biosynthesis protein EgtB [Gemmatimonadaceae bacterium]